MLVLGIDPGVAITGYGLLEGSSEEARLVASGVITTDSTFSLSQRLLMLHNELAQLVALYQPQVAAAEELFFARNARTALMVGHGRGAALLTLAEAGLVVYEYTPMQVKQAVVGYGRAAKGQVQEMLRLLLHLDAVLEPDDAADAVAVALCHLHSARLNDLLAGSKDAG